MSGIFGYLQNPFLPHTPVFDTAPLHAWNKPYGKEAEAVVKKEFWSLGCCYEKLSATSPQNFSVLKKGETYAVLDALLYNREELIQQLHSCEDLSDEDLLFSYIDKFGITSLCNVNGDFSGAIYNETEKELLLFRDHLGVRPLFYYPGNHLFAFSTDLRGLLAFEPVDPSINEDWVYKTMCGYLAYDTESTEFSHIFCVNPAEYIRVSFKAEQIKIKKQRYWSLGKTKIRYSYDLEYQRKMRELITDSVQRRLNAVSGLVGAELSGGLDSGVIDILIHRLGREAVFFSWSYDPSELSYAKDDERLVIQDICEQENITCHYASMHLNSEYHSNMRQNLQSIGVPLDSKELPALQYVLPPYINAMTLCETSQFLHNHGTRVVFSGHGGDEGVSHRCNPYELFYHHEYYHFFRHLWSRTHGQKRRLIQTLRRCKRVYSTVKHSFRKPFIASFQAPQFLRTEFSKRFDNSKMPLLTFAYDAINYINSGGSRIRLDNVSILGAYSGVRYLVPFLDYRVIDFAVSIPRHLYIKGTTDRYIYRQAFKDIMPASLYKVNYKSINSKDNLPPNPNWFEIFAQKKEMAASKLDRNLWSPYLNFDEIDRWVTRGKPSDEDRFQEECNLMVLFQCTLIQNMLDKTRPTKNN